MFVSTVLAVSLAVSFEFSASAARRAVADTAGRLAAVDGAGWFVAADRAQVEVFDDGGQRVILVTCPSGIGGLTLRCEKPPPTGTIRLRLRYAPGRPFEAVEGFEVEIGDRRLSARHTPHRRDVSAAAKDSPALKFRNTADHLEVEIPCDARKAAGDISIRWVDYYR